MGNTTSSTITEPLHWEARGTGQPVLLIAGTPGDGGQFEDVAAELARDHLVISYDRRGTSRSAGAAEGQTPSVASHADDAAELLAAIGVRDVLVYGTSNGAFVALELALRHPASVASLLVHEPPLVSVLRDPGPILAATGEVIGTAMEAGGPPAALDAFLRFAFGDAVVDAWSPGFRDRMLANAEMVFSIEMPAFQSYRPDPDALARCATPACVLVGEEQALPFFMEAAEWLGGRLNASVRRVPGAHGPQFTAPAALAAAIKEMGRSL